jgi:site-specific DNA recombinase
LRDEAGLEQELRLILGRLEDFTSRVKEGLQTADWSTRREIIRALVKRVEIDQEQVQVVFRIGPNTPSSPSDKNTQSLQHCRRGGVALIGKYRVARDGRGSWGQIRLPRPTHRKTCGREVC